MSKKQKLYSAGSGEGGGASICVLKQKYERFSFERKKALTFSILIFSGITIIHL